MMNKREREAIARKIVRLAEKAAKKRDEVRALEGDMQAILDSIESGAEELDWLVNDLQSAKRRLEDAGDAMSQYV